MNKTLLNSAAKWALVLGALMSASRIYETSVMVSGDLMKFAFLTVEWFVAAALYIFIIYKANKVEARKAPAEVGYTLRQSFNYSVLISALAGIIVAISSHIYVVNELGGYASYAVQSAESLLSVIREVDASPELVEFYEESAKTIRESGENPPSIFGSVISMVANYIIVGFITALITGFFTRRRPASNTNSEA